MTNMLVITQYIVLQDKLSFNIFVFFKPSLTILSLTVSLLEYTMIITYEYQVIITILPSWYIVIRDSVVQTSSHDTTSKAESTKRLEPLEITNHQIEHFLKDFSMKNCRQPESFDVLQKLMFDDFEKSAPDVAVVKISLN